MEQHQNTNQPLSFEAAKKERDAEEKLLELIGIQKTDVFADTFNQANAEQHEVIPFHRA